VFRAPTESRGKKFRESEKMNDKGNRTPGSFGGPR